MRALLAAYPARLRRKHGAELLETMAEMAGPGGRATRAEKRQLVLDGVRERFRPPTRRPLAVAAAVLALLIGGAFGAAAGSWAGTWGYAELPDVSSALTQPGVMSATDHYLYADGTIPAGTDVQTEVELTSHRLAAEGWTTGPITAGDGTDGVLKNVHFAAENADVRLDVYAYPDAGGAPAISIAGWPRRPASYVPLTVAGALLGLLAGWLIGVALSHRIQAARRPRLSALLTATGLILVIPSAVGFLASLVRYLTIADPLGTGELVHAHGFAFGPTIDLLRALDLGEGWYLTPSDLQQLPLYGFALIAIAAILARPTREHRAVA
ncbi:hypothetical protein [Paractinoplanes toevensis]|uniref:Uncharacterized protein n=1 Tax=Paractinoplanes toevensis TaxID=571911 RepID=A0A919W3H3_9ACTN|nr:hypothetical protein [Actinoplanes toevensis]GIM94757.1 hypothetical protein Ato02nite_065500 [Actinoplanes toevensis]